MEGGGIVRGRNLRRLLWIEIGFNIAAAEIGIVLTYMIDFFQNFLVVPIKVCWLYVVCITLILFFSVNFKGSLKWKPPLDGRHCSHDSCSGAPSQISLADSKYFARYWDSNYQIVFCVHLMRLINETPEVNRKEIASALISV